MIINAQDYLYCPICALTLGTKFEDERLIKYCSRHGEFYPQHDIAVAGIAVRFNGKPHRKIAYNYETLMVLRNKEPHKGLWSFPAGFVNFGERPDDALAREVNEETGLTVIRSKLIKEVVSDDDPRSPKQQSKYYKMVVTGEVKIKDTEENLRVEWWTLNKDAPDPQIAWAHHDELFKNLKRDRDSFTDFRIPWSSEVR